MKRLVFLVVPLLLTVGCKPKERVVYSEKVVTDSTAVIRLSEELKKSEGINTQLLQENTKLRQENTSLRTNTSVSVIEYDTKGQINPTTGLYPIARETKSQSETTLENTVRNLEEANKTLYSQLNTTTQMLKDKEERVEELTNRVTELDKKTSPQSGTRFRIVAIALSIGIVAGMLIWNFFGKNISYIFSLLFSFFKQFFR